MTAFFEDVSIGDRLDLGSYTFSGAEIKRFARKFDPQAFHLSEEAAAKTHFKRLCASGWHTGAVYMKLFIARRQADERAAAEAGQDVARQGPSPGFENLKWLKPVYPGDTVAFSNVVTGKRALKSRPEWGLIFAENHGINQHGDTVFSFKSKVLVERRPASPGLRA